MEVREVNDSRVTPWRLAFSEPLSEKSSSDKNQIGEEFMSMVLDMLSWGFL